MLELPDPFLPLPTHLRKVRVGDARLHKGPENRNGHNLILHVCQLCRMKNRSAQILPFYNVLFYCICGFIKQHLLEVHRLGFVGQLRGLMQGSV